MYYDLTGTNPEYKVTDHRFMVFEANQVIELMQPVFASSIEVMAILPGGAVPMAQNVDWELDPLFNDDMGTSEAKIQDETFTDTLVHAIRINKPFVSQYLIGVTYQKLRSSLIDLAILEGIPDEYNPNLLAELVQSVRYLESVAGLGDILGSTIDSIQLLHEDLTGIHPDNWVEAETHTMDVLNNKQVIKPLAGSYYAHDLVVRNASNGTPLVKGTDYLIIGANLVKDRIAQHPSGVFDYIYLVTPFTGDIEIDYHAFGGEPTIADYEALNAAMIQVAHLMATGSFVTTGNLPDHNYIIDINRRITILEDWRRAVDFLVPKYEFSTLALSQEYHWYNIAHMWKKKVDDGHIYTKGSMNIRIKYRDHDYVTDATLTIDMENASNKVDSVVMSTVGTERTRVLSEIPELPILPVVRIIALNDPQPGDSEHFLTGVQIQLGVHGDVIDTIHIEHHSSFSSEIFMNEDGAATPGPKDNNVLMPDGTTVWNDGDPNAFVEYMSLAPDDGFLIWRGAMPLDKAMSTPINLKSLTRLEYLSMPIFSNFRFVLRDRILGTEVFVDSPIAKADTTLLHGMGAVLDPMDGVALRASLLNGILTYPNIELQATLGQYTQSNTRYVLEQILIRA